MCACADSALSMMVQLGGSRGIRSFDHVIRAVVMTQAMYGVLSVAMSARCCCGSAMQSYRIDKSQLVLIGIYIICF